MQQKSWQKNSSSFKKYQIKNLGTKVTNLITNLKNFGFWKAKQMLHLNKTLHSNKSVTIKKYLQESKNDFFWLVVIFSYLRTILNPKFCCKGTALFLFPLWFLHWITMPKVMSKLCRKKVILTSLEPAVSFMVKRASNKKLSVLVCFIILSVSFK